MPLEGLRHRNSVPRAANLSKGPHRSRLRPPLRRKMPNRLPHRPPLCRKNRRLLFLSRNLSPSRRAGWKRRRKNNPQQRRSLPQRCRFGAAIRPRCPLMRRRPSARKKKNRRLLHRLFAGAGPPQNLRRSLPAPPRNLNPCRSPETNRSRPRPSGRPNRKQNRRKPRRNPRKRHRRPLHLTSLPTAPNGQRRNLLNLPLQEKRCKPLRVLPLLLIPSRKHRGSLLLNVPLRKRSPTIPELRRRLPRTSNLRRSNGS